MSFGDGPELKCRQAYTRVLTSECANMQRVCLSALIQMERVPLMATIDSVRHRSLRQEQAISKRFKCSF